MNLDVAIVGAGPAGAWAAFRLASGGARVAMFDGSHPREKPCGGGLTGRALALVAAAPELSTLPAVVVRQARFVDSASGRQVDVPLAADGVGPSSALVVASRADFDRRLVESARGAGATLVPERIVNLAAERGGWTLQTTARRARAAVVLGADGANSLVRRRVFEPFRRGQLSIATGFYAEGITSDTVVVDLVSDPPGYIWSFPRPDHLAIGICAQGDCGITSAQLRARARSWMDGRRIAQGAPLKPYAWPIPSLSAAAVAALPLAGPGWCLLGDAAGLVDPITREGIFYALQSADLAADAVLSDHSAPWARYALAVRRQIAPELARAARLKAGFFRPRFSGLLVEALARSTAVRAVMADLVSGRQPYGTLKRRLARTFEVRLAWQLLRLQAGEHLRRPPV